MLIWSLHDGTNRRATLVTKPSDARWCDALSFVGHLNIYLRNHRTLHMTHTMSVIFLDLRIKPRCNCNHYNDVIMGAVASQITSLTVVYSIIYSGADKRKHQSSASLAFVLGDSPVTGEFPTQRASNAENVSIWWRHHDPSNRDTTHGQFDLRINPRSNCNHLYPYQNGTISDWMSVYKYWKQNKIRNLMNMVITVLGDINMFAMMFKYSSIAQKANKMCSFGPCFAVQINVTAEIDKVF